MKRYCDMLADERPEYKAANYGFESLSYTELLSMVINRGAGTIESMSQARQLMNVASGSLTALGKMSMYEMQVVQGIGDCKALAILAALELGKRKAMEKQGYRPDLGSSIAIYNFLHPMMADLQVEEAHLLLMNQNFKLLKHVKLSVGGITDTSVDVRRIMREAVMCNATIVALAHNHPSGSPYPSKDDDRLTTQIHKACEVMRLFFMDHVIITDGAFYSYHDKGKL
nr:DNA repair protein RadC [uncultured Prevotella sp.]